MKKMTALLVALLISACSANRQAIRIPYENYTKPLVERDMEEIKDFFDAIGFSYSEKDLEKIKEISLVTTYNPFLVLEGILWGLSEEEERKIMAKLSDAHARDLVRFIRSFSKRLNYHFNFGMKYVNLKDWNKKYRRKYGSPYKFVFRKAKERDFAKRVPKEIRWQLKKERMNELAQKSYYKQPVNKFLAKIGKRKIIRKK